MFAVVALVRKSRAQPPAIEVCKRSYVAFKPVQTVYTPKRYRRER